MVLASKDNLDSIWNPNSCKNHRQSTHILPQNCHFFFNQFARRPWSNLYVTIFGFTIGAGKSVMGSYTEVQAPRLRPNVRETCSAVLYTY